MLGHLLGLFLAHRPAQQVGPAQGVAADDLRDLHHLLLIDDDAVGGFEAGLEVVVEIVDGLLAFLPQDEVVDHARAQGAGAVEGEHGDDVFEAVGLELLEELLHPLRFELEDGGGVRLFQDLVGGRILVAQGFEFGATAGESLDVVEGEVDDGEVAQPQEVEFHQTDRLHVVLVELRHGHGVLAVGQIQGTIVGELARGDEHAAGVHAHVARQSLERPGELPQLLDRLAVVGVFHQLAQLRFELERLVERHRFDALERDELGEAVAQAIGQVEYAPHVAHHGFGGHGAEGGDLAHRVVPITIAHVLDHSVAPILAEVDVEVGHGYPLGVEEALEEERIAQGVEVGDAQAVGDERACARTASRADGHAVFLGPVDEVGHDEEVAGKAHLDDGSGLEGEPLFVARALAFALGLDRVEFAQTHFQPFLGALDEVVVQRHARWRGEGRQEILAQRDGERGAPRDLAGVLQRLGQVGEALGHLGAAEEVLLGGKGLGAPGVGEHRALGDAHARLVRLEILWAHELDGVRGHHRQPQAGGEPDCGFHVELGVWLPGALQLEVEGVGEDLGPAPRRRFGFLFFLGEQQAPRFALHRPGEGDEAAAGFPFEPSRVDLGAAAVLVLEIGATEELAQLAIAFAVAGNEQHPPGVGAVLFVADPDVHADHRLDALGARGLVELDHAEEVHRIRDAQGGHAVGGGRGDGIREGADAVGERVFRVQAQMDVGRHQGSRRVAPMVRRDSSARWASAAWLSGKRWPILTSSQP